MQRNLFLVIFSIMACFALCEADDHYIYSEEDPELVLAQIAENGLTTTYQYDSLTKQCMAALQSDGNRLLSRCFYFYDTQGFLEKMICDDGQSQQSNDLTGVTQRQTIYLQMGHQFPIVGKPVKIESYYWHSHDSDSNETLFYEVRFEYDRQGQLISAVDNKGEVALQVQSNSSPWMFIDPFLFYEDAHLYDSTQQNEKYEFVSAGQLWNSIVNAFFYSFSHLQLSAHQARMKWNAELKLPSPIGEALEKIGKGLLGESTYLLMGPHFEETHVDCYGQREISDKVRVTFINGILNTQNMILSSLNVISESHGGTKVHYVFRPTEGWTWDISRAIVIKTAFTLGFRSLHANLLAQLWRELIQEIGGIEGGGVIIHYAHSLGGSETDRARDLLSPEEQKMIRVVTFGSSTLVRNVGFQSVINNVSVNDGVSSFLLEPLGYFRNYFDPNTNVCFYGSFFSSPIWPTDHLLNGPTYGPLLRELGEKFLIEFNPK